MGSSGCVIDLGASVVAAELRLSAAPGVRQTATRRTEPHSCSRCHARDSGRAPKMPRSVGPEHATGIRLGARVDVSDATKTVTRTQRGVSDRRALLWRDAPLTARKRSPTIVPTCVPNLDSTAFSVIELAHPSP